uniref:PDZ domain-containing protein n=1 Tax=Glossina palpalis gambiensis TaxID=67801 RepID=A0A1B0BF33_9MUSC
MFNFMKKGVAVASGAGSDREKAEREEKEKRKREKKLRKEAKNATGVPGSMSTEELLRLDEVRRSLKIRGRRKEKEKLPSGITADYSAEFFAALNADNGSSVELDRGNEEIVASVTTTIESRHNGGGSTVHSISETMSPHSNASGDNLKNRFMSSVPPKPPKRGILKGSRSNASNIHEEVVVTSPEAQILVIRNTMQNELLFDGNRSMCGAGSIGSNSSQHCTSFTSVESLRSDEGGIQRAMTLPTSARYTSHVPHSNLRVMTSPSPSADSLTDTTNSSFATPPFSLSPVGESQGIERWSRVQSFDDIDLPLPLIRLVKLPPPRQLTIRRQKSPRQDFGFSLRKAICLDRTESLTAPAFKPVIFAEPGAGGGSTGLLPGDRLLKVNGTSVNELSREVIIEMIRNSEDSVTVEVQPVPELVELSRRCMPQGTDENHDRSNLNATNCNTLKRSASKRLKSKIHTEAEKKYRMHKCIGFILLKPIIPVSLLNSHTQQYGGYEKLLFLLLQQ